jgi:hypothetical protein
MPAYEIYVHCVYCGGEHPLLMRIRKQSIAESFRGRSMPPQVLAIKGHQALCLKTGKKFQLEKDEQVFLVPPSSF